MIRLSCLETVINGLHNFYCTINIHLLQLSDKIIIFIHRNNTCDKLRCFFVYNCRNISHDFAVFFVFV